MSGNEHLVSGWMLNLFDSALSEFHPKKTPKKQLPVFHFNLKKKNKASSVSGKHQLIFFILSFSSVTTLEKQVFRQSKL